MVHLGLDRSVIENIIGFGNQFEKFHLQTAIKIG